MSDRKEYRFKIDVFTPDTLPMARLAEYMARLADLLGHEQSVHFDRIEKGSAVLVPKIDDPDVPKVQERLQAVRRHAGPKDAQKAFEQLDRMLAKDNAIGTLIEDTDAEIIKFPGRTRPQPITYGPFNEQGALSGVLIRIGGKDETVPVHIQDGDVIYKCNTNREIARELAHHLFASPIRVKGSGRWHRDEEGAWELDRFNISEFEELDDAPLGEAVQKLRAVPGSGWKDSVDPLGELQRLRGDDDEIH